MCAQGGLIGVDRFVRGAAECVHRGQTVQGDSDRRAVEPRLFSSSCALPARLPYVNIEDREASTCFIGPREILVDMERALQCETRRSCFSIM